MLGCKFHPSGTLIGQCRVIFGLAVLWLIVGAGARAQDAPDLTASFLSIAPFGIIDEAGERSGFFVDLAEAIASEIGLSITYVEPENTREFVQFQISGQTQIFAGVARLPPLEATNVFSDPVATEALRLTALTETAGRISAGAKEGLRIGIVPPAVGSAEAELLAANVPVEFTGPELALFSLLKGEIDAVLAPEPVMPTLARQIGVDARIGFVEPPIRQFDRYVALHESRADLLGDVNAAIARLEADGRLADLRARYFIDTPPPMPPVLSVAIAHFPPHMIVDDAGAHSGFIIEVTQDLADKAGVQIALEPVPTRDFLRGPRAAGTDISAGLVGTRQRLRQMDFTLPIRHVDLWAVTRPDLRREITSLSDLGALRVGVVGGSIVEVLTRAPGTVDVVGFPTNDLAFDGLLTGAVDAMVSVLGPENPQIQAALSEGTAVLVPTPVSSIDTAIALRFGLSDLRERLDAVIPAYLLSERYAGLVAKYYGTPVFWTLRRQLWVASAVGAVFLCLIAYAFAQRVQKRRLLFAQKERELAKEREYTDALNRVIADLKNANQEQAEFTYAISHDLKSPSNTLGMLIQELEEVAEIGLDGRVVLSDMKTTNHRMGRLIEDVLNYSRVVDEKLRVEPVSLEDLLTGIGQDLASEIVAANAQIIQGDLPVIDGHPAQLRLLFQNLISNAIKFRAPDRAPVIQISSEQAGDHTVVRVADNGIGIPPEQRETVFGLFQRVYVQSEFEGSGIGLAICRRVMTNHGGQIAALARDPHGTVFELTFPAQPSGAAEG